MKDPIPWTPEVLAYLRAGYEQSIAVWGPEVNDDQSGWHVVDAECDVIARCDTKDAADIVAFAMDLYIDEMERRRSAEIDAWSAAQPEGGDPDGS
jgi:hypothetical protein